MYKLSWTTKYFEEIFNDAVYKLPICKHSNAHIYNLGMFIVQYLQVLGIILFT